MSHSIGGTVPPPPIALLRCPKCGYAEVVDDSSWLSPRGLSDGWCGHDREAFVRVLVEPQARRNHGY